MKQAECEKGLEGGRMVEGRIRKEEAGS